MKNKGKELESIIQDFVDVGDEIFIIEEFCGKWVILDEELESYVIYPEGNDGWIRTGKYTTDYYDIAEIGKTIFATRKEAEAKLKELQNER